MRSAFWKTTGELWRFKKLLAAAAVGALVSALCFGAGLAMLLPIFRLFFSPETATGVHPLRSLVNDALVAEHAAPWRIELAARINGWIPQDVFQSFLLVMSVVLVLALIGSIGRYTHELLTISAVQRVAVRWRARLFERLIYSPLGAFRDEGSGEASRVIIDVTLLARAQQAILGKAVSEVLKGAAALCVAVLMDWRLTLLALVAAPLIAFSMRKFGKVVKRASKRALKQQSAILKALNSAYVALPIIKTHNAESYERRRFNPLNKKLYAEQMTMRQARALAGPVVEMLGMLGVMATATIAAWYFFQSGQGAERFLVVLLTLAAAGASLRPLTQLHVQIKEADAAAARILQGASLPLEPVGRRTPRDLPRLPRHTRQIACENVAFTYPGAATPAVRDVSFSVPFGSTTAIVGANGSGKSTLMNLLPRLREPDAGRVLIDDIDVTTVTLRSLREQISMVTQQTILFEGTIAQNIAYARPTIAREAIVEAAKLANAHEFIARLPAGYDTMLGEGGEGLSGGQRQRLAIARAVLTNPSILILDEATSQIDADSEAKINQALRAVRRGRTTFVIAHRLSTVIDADRIFVMVDGRIVDRGTHRELLDRCAAYQMLTRSQLQPPAA